MLTGGDAAARCPSCLARPACPSPHGLTRDPPSLDAATWPAARTSWWSVRCCTLRAAGARASTSTTTSGASLAGASAAPPEQVRCVDLGAKRDPGGLPGLRHQHATLPVSIYLWRLLWALMHVHASSSWARPCWQAEAVRGKVMPAPTFADCAGSCSATTTGACRRTSRCRRCRPGRRVKCRPAALCYIH